MKLQSCPKAESIEQEKKLRTPINLNNDNVGKYFKKKKSIEAVALGHTGALLSQCIDDLSDLRSGLKVGNNHFGLLLSLG